MAIRIAIVDDHRLFREGLRAILARQGDMEIVAEAAEPRAALAAIQSTQPDVVVLDLALPGASGIAVARDISRMSPAPRVLVLSMLIDEEHVAQALEVGIAGYACKEDSSDEVAGAIRAIAGGKSYLTPRISRFVLDEYMRMRNGASQRQGPLRQLTSREREIFDLVVQGMDNHSIAGRLTISHRTVETHRCRVMRKLGVHTAADLVRVAARHGLLAP